MNKDSPRKTLNRTYLIILQLSFPCHLMGFYSTREDGAQREHLVRKHWSIKIERAFLFPLKWDKNKFNLLYEVFVHMKSNIQRMFLKINFFFTLTLYFLTLGGSSSKPTTWYHGSRQLWRTETMGLETNQDLFECIMVHSKGAESSHALSASFIWSWLTRTMHNQ